MDNEVRRIAEQAGFIFWGNEEWRPSDGNVIDWACDYTKEFEKFVELYREHVLRKEKEWTTSTTSRHLRPASLSAPSA